jgi:hypothetical protein
VNSTAIVKRSDVIDAIFIEDRSERRIVGVGDAPTPSPMTPATVGFIAIGSAVAGFMLGFAVCDTFSKG